MAAILDFPIISHRIHGAGVYANIWGILMVNVTIYIAYMDPMGIGNGMSSSQLTNSMIFQRGRYTTNVII